MAASQGNMVALAVGEKGPHESDDSGHGKIGSNDGDNEGEISKDVYKDPEIEWIGPAIRIDEATKQVYYQSVLKDGLKISLGDTVFLTPLERGVEPYIGRVNELMEVPAVPAAARGEGEELSIVKSEHAPQYLVTIVWYYRMEELELDAPLPVYENEIFASDDAATHPIAAISGHCQVESPNSHSAQPGFFVCSRKYIPEEGRVVPFEGIPEPSQPRPYFLVPETHQLVLASKAATSGTSPPIITPSIRVPPIKAPPATTPPRKHKVPSKRKRRSSDLSGESGGAAPSVSTSNEELAAGLEAPGGARSSGETGVIGTPKRSGGSAGTPKSRTTQHGRWASDRYEGAKRHLVHVLNMMDATSPDKAVLRPLLREEARKVIGDTGLLDHLLKHLVDQIVGSQGERLRRRHNAEGQMIYWLQSPAAARQEEAQLREEMEALTSELREVREARHMLQAVRQEAAEAVQAVSGLKDHPEEIARAIAAGPSAPPQVTFPVEKIEIMSRLESLEQEYVALSRRIYDAESLAASSIEAVRQDSASAGMILSGKVGDSIASINAIEERVSDLENKYKYLSEEIIAKETRFLQYMQQELAQRDSLLTSLQQEVGVLRALIAGLGAVLPSDILDRWIHLQQQYIQNMNNVARGDPLSSSAPLEANFPSPGMGGGMQRTTRDTQEEGRSQPHFKPPSQSMEKK